MKKILTLTLFAALAARSAHADTTLTVGDIPFFPTGGPCWDDILVVPSPPVASGSFALTGVSGTGTINSAASIVVDNVHGQQHVRYSYSLDASAMSAPANHCIKLLVHFGSPLLCSYNVLVVTNGSGGINVSSATLKSFGDINVVFGSGCLTPGETATSFEMLSDNQPRTNYVTVIDDYTNPGNGQTDETRVNVTAIVPDVPPNWAFVPPFIPSPFFQGNLSCNSVPMLNLSGPYNFSLQLVDAASNGLPIGPVSTQTVQVVNGLFNLPLSFDPVSMGDGSAHWLSVGVNSSVNPGPTQFLSPALPLTPAPQALYAYSAGVVADIAPGQAVTSLNGLTGPVSLQAGNGIVINSGGDILTISAVAGVGSDRNIKTDFAAVQPGDVLARLARLPIQSWRYTNEVAGVRHVGPMAQDFNASFGVGTDGRMIYFVDEEGVALAAIQGLNQKVEVRNEKDEGELRKLEAENTELKQRLDALEKTIGNQKPN